jgi:tight adherence protein B
VIAALAAGALAAALCYLALIEFEAWRHERTARLALLGPPAKRPTVPAVGRVWTRISEGELPLMAIRALATATLLLFIASLVLRALSLSLLAALVGIVVGYAYVQRQRWTLAARVDGQLAPAMHVMASALTAGATLFQALEAAANETAAPFGTLLRAAVSRAQLTATVEESLRDLRDRIGSRDLGSVVAALAIARTTGGNIARLLRESADLLREEQRLRADARALSAQARYSAQLIGVMPVVLFVLFSAMFPSFIEPLTTTTVGLAVVGYGAASTGLGFYFIWRIATRIERI